MRIKVASPEFKDRARSLRRSSTEAESSLWQLLRNKSLGVHFRGQRSIGPYIVDFYCPQHGLVIEVDGSQHSLAEQRANDEERTAHLTGLGLQVFRFQNDEVLSHPEDVLDRIRRAISPSPCKGEGIKRLSSPSWGR